MLQKKINLLSGTKRLRKVENSSKINYALIDYRLQLISNMSLKSKIILNDQRLTITDIIENISILFFLVP